VLLLTNGDDFLDNPIETANDKAALVKRSFASIALAVASVLEIACCRPVVAEPLDVSFIDCALSRADASVAVIVWNARFTKILSREMIAVDPKSIAKAIHLNLPRGFYNIQVTNLKGCGDEFHLDGTSAPPRTIVR